MSRTTVSSSIIPHSQLDYRIPPGEYHVTLTRAAVTNRILTAEFELIRGTHAGQCVFAIFDLADNSHPGSFATYCRTVGVLSPKCTDDLAGKPVLAKVKNRTLDGVTFPVVAAFAKPLYQGAL